MKLLKCATISPEEKVMKKQLIYALNSLELLILIFTKVSWGYYAKDPDKFLLKLADVA